MLPQVQLLFMVVFLEMGLILMFLFRTPLRKLIIMSLDRVKRGSGPLIVKSVAATVLVIMIYTVYSIKELQSRPADSVNPTDQILLAHQILEAALMGMFLFFEVFWFVCEVSSFDWFMVCFLFSKVWTFFGLFGVLSDYHFMCMFLFANFESFLDCLEFFLMITSCVSSFLQMLNLFWVVWGVSFFLMINTWV